MLGQRAKNNNKADPEKSDISQDAVNTQLAKLLQSESFRTSPRLSALLRHLVVNSHEGNERELKEYAIGVEVFGKNSSFDPRSDTIVRVQARRLRDRLEAYYTDAGKSDPIRLDIPKGHYLVVFQSNTEPQKDELRWYNNLRIRAFIGVISLAVFLIGGLYWWSLKPGSQMGKAPILESLAVLPFKDLSAAGDQQYLAEGIADGLRDQLGRIANVKVAARASSSNYPSKLSDVREAADNLGVEFIIEGDVDRQEELLIVNVTITDGKTGKQIAELNAKNGNDDLMSLQRELSNRIAKTFRSTAGEELIAPDVKGHSVSAHDLLLLGRHYELLVKQKTIPDKELLNKAIDLYSQAVELDPNSAISHSRLASALIYKGDIKAAKEPIFKALSLNQDISEVQDTLGKYYFRAQLPGAGAAWQRAVELNPNNADALSSYAYWIWMQPMLTEEPEKLWRQALSLDPLTLSRYADLGNFYGKMGWKKETLGVAEQVTQVFNSIPAHQVVARLYELAGEVDIAIAWVMRAKLLEPTNPELSWQLAELYAVIGDFDSALEYEPQPGIGLLFFMRRYEELIEECEFILFQNPGYVDIKYMLGFAYNAVGRHEDAVQILEEAKAHEAALSESKQADSVEAYVSLYSALFAQDKHNQARRLVKMLPSPPGQDFPKKFRDWYFAWLEGCASAVLGNDEKALKILQDIPGSPRIMWSPYLLDTPCFKNLVNEPDYQQVVTHLEGRKRLLRERLAETLKNYGVVGMKP